MNYQDLPDDALLRTREICRPHGPVPYRRSAWLQRVATGRAPQPALRTPRMTCWRWRDVREYLRRLAAETPDIGGRCQ